MTVRGRNGDGAPRTWLTALVWLGLLLGIAAFAAGAYSQPQALLPMWGKSWNWIARLLVLTALATIAQRRTRRPAVVMVALGSAVLLGAFGLAATASVVVVTLTAFALGAWLLDRAGTAAGGDTGPPPIATTAVGLAALALLFGVTAHFGVNIAPAYLAISAFSIWLGRRRVVRLVQHLAAVARTRSFETTPPFVVGAALWFGFGIAMYYAALPERYHDALAMHLVIPRALELFGRWNFDVADNVWAVWPLGGDLLFGWAYVLAGEAGARLLNLALLLMTCGLVIEARFVSRAASMAAVAAFMLMPLTIVETGSLFVENALALFLAAAIVFASRLARNPAQGVAAIAIALGGAVVVKLYGVVALGAVALSVTVTGAWRVMLSVPARVWALVLAAALLGCLAVRLRVDRDRQSDIPLLQRGVQVIAVPAPELRQHLPGRAVVARPVRPHVFVVALSGSMGRRSGVRPDAAASGGPDRGRAQGSARASIGDGGRMSYLVAALISTRYLRYLYPALPWLFVVAVVPLDYFSGKGRTAVAVALALVVGAGIARIPSAGWIIGEFKFPLAFSPREKEALC